MSDSAPPADEDPSSPAGDELADLDEETTARLAARVWGRFLGRNPELREEAGDQ